MTWVTKDYDFYELLWPQILRGCGIMISMIPVNNIALGTLPPERIKNASGLFNLTRNLGGAVGLAIINTQLNDRIDLHLARLHDAVTWSRPAAMEMLNNLTQRFASYGSDAHAMALKQMSLLARREGIVMGYADIFLMLTVLFIALSLMSVILSKPAPAAAGAGGGH